MQLLRDNLTLWTSDMQGDGKTQITFYFSHFKLLIMAKILSIVGEGEQKEPIQDVEDQDVS